MKRKLSVLAIVVALVVAVSSIPTIVAESDDIETTLALAELVTPTKVIDLEHSNINSIDMLVGESITIKTNILIKKPIVIEDDSSIKAIYRYDNNAFDVTIKRGAELVNNGNYDSGNAYLRREEVTITAKANVTKSQFIAEYFVGGRPYFDSININVIGTGENVIDDISSMELKPNVTTLKSNQKVDFDLIINGSATLGISGNISYNINGVDVTTLNGYTVGNVDKLDIKIKYTSVDGAEKTYTSTLDVANANALSSIKVDKDSYGYLLKNSEGRIAIYCTKGSYPNINIVANSVTLKSTEMIESDIDDMDKYVITLALKKATKNEEILISADDMPVTTTINIIDNIDSLTIVPESTKFESGKVNVFHIAINGIKDVDTPVTWTINGVEQQSKANVIEHKSISNNDVIVTAVVDGFNSEEYKYSIDTSKDSMLLTVIVSAVVIAIFLPILIMLSKKKKPDLKALILKDNDNIMAKLTKLKEDINSDADKKALLKHILRISSLLTRSEKRAQQEAFECENKAFSAALTSITESKDLVGELISRKNLPKDVMINIIDNAILSLENANSTIKRVQDNM